MFEQSLLLDPAPGKKAGALAASLTVQSVALGGLLLIPLIYTERLPFSNFDLPTFLPPAPSPPPEEPVSVEAHRWTPRAYSGPIVTPTKTPPLVEYIDGLPLQPATPFIGIPGSIPGGLPQSVFTGIALPPPPAPKPVDFAPPRPVRLTSEILSAKLLRKVVPVYPRLAITAHVSGTVHLLGTVGTDGAIRDLQVVSGPSLLVEAALEAVRQWVYSPTLLNGTPVEVTAPIDVVFTLRP
jgi:periplasmic protein TonB